MKADADVFLAACRRILRAMARGAKTFEEVRAELAGVSGYADRAGCQTLLQAMEDEGWVVTCRARLRPFASLETLYGLPDDVAACRVCGCITDLACEGGCSWVEDDLCSKCVGK